MKLSKAGQKQLDSFEKANPILICGCGSKFRKFGWNRNGEKRTYTRCMNCFMEDFAEQTSKYKEEEEHATD